MEKNYIIDKRDENIKRNIINMLQKEGYATYGYILSRLKFKVTDDVKTAAYNPVEKLILINPSWDLKFVSFVVRHEILHGVLKHFERTKTLLGDQFWVEIDATQNKARLWATDLELGDKGYTPGDIELAKESHGLVVSEIEKQYGLKLAGKSYEEIYKVLYDKFKEDEAKENELKDMLKDMESSESESEDEGEGESSSSSSADSGSSSTSDTDSKDAKGSVTGPIEIDLSDGKNSAKGEKADNPVLSDEDLKDILDIKAELDEEAEKLDREIKDDADKHAKSLSKKVRKAIDKLLEAIDDTVKGDLGEMSEETKNDLKDVQKTLDEASETETVLKSFKQDAINATLADELKASSELDDLAAKHRAEINDRKSGFLYDFEKSLEETLSAQVGVSEEETWRKLNKTYDGTGIYKKARSQSESGFIPEVNVYIDRSGSWGPSVYAQGLKAVGILDELKEKGKIKVNIYYFAIYVHTDATTAAKEVFNSGQPVIDHIKATKPTNVVIMTDLDIDYPDAPLNVFHHEYRRRGEDDGTFGHKGTYIGKIKDTSVRVPGKVWYLVPDGHELKVCKILKGFEGTELYNLTSGKKVKRI